MLAPDPALVEQILGALAWQVHDPDLTKDGGHWFPSPANWIRKRRWEVVPPAPIRPAPAVGSAEFSLDRFRAERGIVIPDRPDDENPLGEIDPLLEAAKPAPHVRSRDRVAAVRAEAAPVLSKEAIIDDAAD